MTKKIEHEENQEKVGGENVVEENANQPLEENEESLTDNFSEESAVVEEEDFKEKWQRTLAEMENMRKRQEVERKETVRFALADFIEKLLPVVDNFYRATEHIPEDQKQNSWVSGISYIQKNLLDVLEQEGVEEISTKPGELFDPARQEAIGTVLNDSFQEDEIVEVKRRGYLLHQKVLRPAQVIVAKN